MFFWISVGFVTAWAPYAVVSFLFIFHKEHLYMAPQGFVFPALFAKRSHVYNPFIYFYFNKTFRRELRRLLLSLWLACVLGGNRVRVHTPAELQYPIHIQLQERAVVQKATFGLSQGRTRSKGRRKGNAAQSDSGGVLGRPVCTCWGSPSKKSPRHLGQ